MKIMILSLIGILFLFITVTILKDTYVKVYNWRGNLIKEYWTLSEAVKETGIGRDNILRCIKGKNRHAGGYLWFYK